MNMELIGECQWKLQCSLKVNKNRQQFMLENVEACKRARAKNVLLSRITFHEGVKTALLPQQVCLSHGCIFCFSSSFDSIIPDELFQKAVHGRVQLFLG